MACRFNQCMCYFAIDARQAYVEPGLQEKASFVGAEIDFCVDGRIGGQTDA